AMRTPHLLSLDASDDFEVPSVLPVGHRLQVLPPLPLPCAGKVVYKLFAEDLTGELGIFHALRGFPQCRRQRWLVGIPIGIARRLGLLEFHALTYTIKSRPKGSCHRQIRVDV